VKDYEIEVDINIAKVGAALLADKDFMQSLSDAMRKLMLQTARANPDIFGGGTTTKPPRKP